MPPREVNPIKLGSPDFGHLEQEMLNEVLASGWLVQGPKVNAFEEAIAKRVGRKHAIAVSSGTAALELALEVLEVKEGEVVVPGLTWPSPAHAAQRSGAEVVVADVDAHEWNSGWQHFEERISHKTRALIAIDQFGNPARFEEILSNAKVPVVEDAACAIGSSMGGKACGSFGVISCMSFHPRKILTTGEGGMCLTDDDELAKRLRILRNHGQEAAGVFAEAGPNERMSELHAALGLAQLSKLDSMIETRLRLRAVYRDRLTSLPSLRTQQEPPKGQSNGQTFGVLLPLGLDRDQVLLAVRSHLVECGKLSYSLRKIGSLSARAKAFATPNADLLEMQGIALPLHSKMTEDDVHRCVDALQLALQ